MKLELDFRPASEPPTEEGDYVLYNQCDGYHVAGARFYGNEFDGFCFFGEFDPEPKDCYQAWEKLPAPSVLYAEFSRDAVSAETEGKNVTKP